MLQLSSPILHKLLRLFGHIDKQSPAGIGVNCPAIDPPDPELFVDTSVARRPVSTEHCRHTSERKAG